MSGVANNNHANKCVAHRPTILTTLGDLLVHITKTLLTPRAARRPPPMPGHPGAGRGSCALPKKKTIREI